MRSEYLEPTRVTNQGDRSPDFEKPYGRAWISTCPLAVDPPISPGVDALTFLRSTSQGVEARFAPLQGRGPNGFDRSRPIRASFVQDQQVPPR